MFPDKQTMKFTARKTFDERRRICATTPSSSVILDCMILRAAPYSLNLRATDSLPINGDRREA
jgi:hypothetical protein